MADKFEKNLRESIIECLAEINAAKVMLKSFRCSEKSKRDLYIFQERQNLDFITQIYIDKMFNLTFDQIEELNLNVGRILVQFMKIKQDNSITQKSWFNYFNGCIFCSVIYL